MGALIHLNGAPGVGKLTIARLMAQRLAARVLDNHAIYNVGFALADFRSTLFYEAVRSVRTAAYATILSLPDDEAVILTAADFEGSRWGEENWQALDALASSRKWPFFAILLTCDSEEHRRRIVAEDRAARGKLRDAEAVVRLLRRKLIAGRAPRSLSLDVTGLTAAAAAERLGDWIRSST